MPSPSVAYTAPPGVEISVTTQDAQREDSVTLYRYSTGGSLDTITVAQLVALVNAIATAQGSLSNGVPVRAAVTLAMEDPTDAALTGPYQSVDDSVKCSYKTTDGETTQKSIAAPLLAIFQPDGETLDATNALVSGYLTNVLAVTADSQSWFGTDEDWNPIAAFLTGYRNWRRRKHGGRPA